MLHSWGSTCARLERAGLREDLRLHCEALVLVSRATAPPTRVSLHSWDQRMPGGSVGLFVKTLLALCDTNGCHSDDFCPDS
jgi:hypothetical protein